MDENKHLLPHTIQTKPDKRSHGENNRRILMARFEVTGPKHHVILIIAIS